jgi:excinuclease ABC subunit A
MEKPDVDTIEGLSPAISIDQKTSGHNPRSTVGTVTEIYDYLRLLYARVGIPHCPICGRQVSRQTATAVVDLVFSKYQAKRLMILAPIVIDKKGAFEHISEQYLRAGFARARVDGVVYSLDEFPELDKAKKHNIEIVIDRLVPSAESTSRLSQSIEQAFDIAEDKMIACDADEKTEELFSLSYACSKHPEVAIPELEPRNFSFNSPHGACPVCTGLGNRLEVDPELVIPNGRLTIAEGAIRPFNRLRIDSFYLKKIEIMAEENGFSIHTPTGQLKESDIQKVLYGTGKQTYIIPLGSGRSYQTEFEGVIPNLQRRYKETESDFIRRDIEKFMQERPCTACHGQRLKPEVLAVTVNDQSIMDVCNLSIDNALSFFDQIKLNATELEIARQILKEIKARLSFLQDVGLNYLSLARSATTLSGGEAQRIRLATQIGSGLTGVLYVLDEPSIGLHQRDNNRLINTLKKLRDLGNTVIVVEHDEDTMRTADYLVDIGPGAGIHGGQVVAQGKPEQVIKDPHSLTGKYLTGKLKIKTKTSYRQGNGKNLEIIGAAENNLKNVSVQIPLAKMVVVSGVSGSGKSSLINDILAKELSAKLNRANLVAGKHQEIIGIENLDKAIVIDQSPIGRTPRSNPATYTGLFTPIRELFAATPEAKLRGYGPGRFSFNVKGGRCENCAGDGIIKIEMHFLPDVFVTCEECKGKRYNREALEIHYKGKTISDVLEMTTEQASEFFSNIPAVAKKLDTLVSVGLGYIRLGQSATTLSGGEAQRIKLASELSRRSTGKTLYILDEPTTGLHMADVDKLLNVLNALVDTGNSMIIIEHNLDVIKSADYIIDMGPEGGDAGGTIVASGTPKEIAASKTSYTGEYLRKIL